MMLEYDSQIKSSYCVEKTCRQVWKYKVIRIIVKCIVLRYSIFSSPASFFVRIVVDASLFVPSPLCKLDKLFELMHRY